MSGKKERFSNFQDAFKELKKRISSPNKQAKNHDIQQQPENRDFRDVEATLIKRGSVASAMITPQFEPKVGDLAKAAVMSSIAAKQGEHSKSASESPKNITGVPGKKNEITILKARGMKKVLAKIIEDEKKAAAPVAKTTLPPKETANALFHRITKLTSQLSPHIENRPSSVSDQTRFIVTEHIQQGALAVLKQQNPDNDGYIIGLDFGTSSVKLAVRQPYKADEPVKAMKAPSELRSFEHPYLWQTVLWLHPTSGMLSLLPFDNAIALEGFKTGLVGEAESELVVPELPITRAEAATAFLALHIAHMFGWYNHARPLGSIGRDQYMAINIGIPVAAHNDERAFSTFKRIVNAAQTLASEATNLTHASVCAIYNEVPDELPPGYHLVPELSAAVAGYADEPTSQPGAHILVDVGASTLDIVAFNLIDRERITVFAASVELLGSAALNVAKANCIDDKDFNGACLYTFHNVYKKVRDPAWGGNGFDPALRHVPVQLLTTGGGCQTSVHEAFIKALNTEKLLGVAPLVAPLPPEQLVDTKCDTSRLLLAYGLALDIAERKDLKLPSAVIKLTPKPQTQNPFIGPEMV